MEQTLTDLRNADVTVLVQALGDHHAWVVGLTRAGGGPSRPCVRATARVLS